jgi:Na+/proline symporter
MYSIALLDTIESVVIIIGLVAVLGYALYTIGGFGNLMDVTPSEFWNVLPENKMSYTEWIIFITALMTMGLGSIPQQDIYQRAMSAKNEMVSMWASILGGLLYITIVMIPLLIALVARVLYPEVLASNPEQLILTLIRDNTPIFIQVLFFGALVSAIISTASGALLAPGTLLAENVVKPFVSGISDTLRLSIIRASVIVVAIGAIILALNPEASIFELVGEAYSATLVAAFIPLAVGLYSKRANSFGALVSIILGISTWQYWEHYVASEIPATFVGFIASAIGIVLGTMISRLIKKEEQIEKQQNHISVTSM